MKEKRKIENRAALYEWYLNIVRERCSIENQAGVIVIWFDLLLIYMFCLFKYVIWSVVKLYVLSIPGMSRCENALSVVTKEIAY